MKRFKIYGVVFVLSLLLTACGASSEVIFGPGEPAGGPEGGEFSDSRVEGMDWSTDAASGTTRQDGGINPLAGGDLVTP